MNAKSSALRTLADRYVEELSQNPLLRDHWPRLSLVLKGSTARGNADRYSDIDFVFFCDEDVRRAVIEAHRRQGLTERTDGVFLPLGNWVGHYHFESFDHLAGYFTERNYPQAWEYSAAIPLHDPGERFRLLIAENMAALLAEPLPAVRDQYLEMQLTLDWLRHPLKRADAVAVALHCADLLRGICRIAYLLDGKPFPHDKWLFHYIGGTRFGRKHRAAILAYSGLLSSPVPRHRELENYPQYVHAAILLSAVADFIRREYGIQPWLDEWWRYV